MDGRLPSWDQADYLNSAVDHGRALGLLPGGGWTGWQDLLDLSPKIPPLASLVNGTVMALTGQGADEASWALAIWHGLLLVVVACWGRQLLGRGFGLLAAALVAAAPALAELRVDYTLDLPLTATATLALWRLGCWQAPTPRGGRWSQAILAALAVVAAVLVKQSALLVVALLSLWAAARGLGQRSRRPQVLLALAIVVGVALPWLKHNWITTLGGTNRAVVQSASAEGDPPVISMASLLWYPRIWPRQLGIALLPGLGAALGAAWRGRRQLPAWLRHPVRHLPPGWGWLLGCAVFGWLGTSLSPNKDPRYVAPVLPLLLLLLARGWWQIGLWLRRLWGPRAAAGALGVALLGAGAGVARSQQASLQHPSPSPIPAAIASLRGAAGPGPLTLLVLPDEPDLNEHTVTSFGRLGGGSILGRRLGGSPGDLPLVLARTEWVLLATGDQGNVKPRTRALSQSIRSDGRFVRVDGWPWTEGRQLELWRRRGSGSDEAQGTHRFDSEFIRLARGMERGPAGLTALFDRIGPEHQLDGHMLYQGRVRSWARQRLEAHPDDPDALWSLALLSTLNNRPQEAAGWFGRLEPVSPGNPWPGSYRAVVLLADWNPWGASEAAGQLDRRRPVQRALADLSSVLSGAVWNLPAARSSVPAAIDQVEREIRQGS